MGQHADLFIKMTHSISNSGLEPGRNAYETFIGRGLQVPPWLLREVEPELPPEPELPNAEKYPTLAATGFVFAEAIDLGPVVKPASACPTCGRLTERVEALTSASPSPLSFR